MQFTPSNPPEFTDIDDAIRWVVGEFQRLVKTINGNTEIDLSPIGREPEKPREGMIVSANGTDWDPGAGVGAYQYIGGAWVKL